MTQTEVKMVIKRAYPKELNIAMICTRLELSRASISRCCKVLRTQDDDIQYRKLANREGRYKWRKSK